MRHYSIWPGSCVIIIPPQLRAHFQKRSWSKRKIPSYVFEKARIKRKEWNECGKTAIVGNKGGKEYTALKDEQYLLLVAAVGQAGGFGAVITPLFDTKNKAVTKPPLSPL